MKFSEIRGKDVIDKNGVKVGEIMDSVFDCSSLELKQFILGGGRIEELLESIGARKDIDPLVDVEQVHAITDKVDLIVDGDSLKKTIDKGAIAGGDRKFSKMSKIKVVDADGFKIGNIIDFWFDKGSQLWFVIGGGFFEEFLEKIRAQPDIDLLIPPEFIDSIDDKSIKLTRTRFQLESTCEDEFEKLKKQLRDKKPHDDARYAHLRLGAGHSRGLV
jgi:sporulation protein YlmC with PRC-barrel domain